MGWFPRSIFFGRNSQLHLGNLRDFNATLRDGQIDPSSLHQLGTQRRQQVRGPALWLLLIAATGGLVLLWLL